MAVIAKKGDSFEFDLIEAGNYIARCYKVIQIGTVLENIKGKDQMLHKVRIGWELPTELKVFDQAKGEQPRVIDKEYTLSLSDKANLRKDLKSWRGKDFTEKQLEGFDIATLAGAACMLNIVHKPSTKDATKMYPEIVGITPLPKAMTCPAAINEKQILQFDKFDETLFSSLPEFIRKKIESSEEYKFMRMPNGNSETYIPDGVDQENDDLPF